VLFEARNDGSLRAGVGKGPLHDREIFVFQPITNIDLTRGAQTCKMMLLGLPLVRRNVSSTTPALTRLAFLLARRDLEQVHKVYPLSGLKLAGADFCGDSSFSSADFSISQIISA
jgi:hypothetical protein